MITKIASLFIKNAGLTGAFWDALNNNDDMLIRIMLKNDMIMNASHLDEHKKMLDAILKKRPDFFRPDAADAVRTMDKARWNDEYLAEQMTRFVHNPSREQYDHMRDVTRHMYPPKSNPDVAAVKQPISRIRKTITPKKLLVGTGVAAVPAAAYGAYQYFKNTD